MNTLDRLALGLEMLEGASNAGMVLSDLLFELGEQSLAKNVRKLRRSKGGLRNLGLMLLPTCNALRLGCRFVSLGLYDLENERLRDQALAPLLEWSDGTATDEDLANFRTKINLFLPLRPGDQSLHDPTLLMNLRPMVKQALEWLVDAIELVQPEPEFDFWSLEANKLVCTIAQLPRRWYSVKASRRRSPRMKNVLDDQLFHLRAHYRHMLGDPHPWQR